MRRIHPTPQIAYVTLLGALLGSTSFGCQGRSDIDLPSLLPSGGAGATTHSATTTTETTTTTTTHTITTATGGGGEGGAGGTGGSGGVQPMAALVRHFLGEVASGDSVELQVPAGTLGMHVVADSANPWRLVGVEQVEAPDGAVLVDGQTIVGTDATYSNYGTVTLGVPQTDDPQAMPLMPGLWSFIPSIEAGGGALDLTVWTRHTIDGQFHGGVIDVNVFVVPGAASETHLRNVLELAFSDFGGLGLGTVTFYPLGDEYSVIDEYNTYDVINESAAATSLPALDVMVVDYLAGMLEGAAGFTLGAPAQSLEHGTNQSALVMMSYGDEFTDALIVKHEAGHFAGLFHTTEFEVGYGDPLSDTPQCDDVWAQMESCPDYDNLMFPTGGSGELALSAQQITVIRGSGLYRGIVAEGLPPAPPFTLGTAPTRAGAAGSPAPWPSEASAGTPAVMAPPRLPERRPSAVEQPWAAGIDGRLAAYLYGLWPARLDAPAPVDHLVSVYRGSTESLLAELRAVAQDPSAPSHVRMRALLGLRRFGAGRVDPSWLETIAVDPRSDRLLTLGALRALDGHRPARARDVAARLTSPAGKRAGKIAGQLARAARP